MRKSHYIILAIVSVIISYYVMSAFVLQQQSINKQSIYVHLEPGWNSYPGNIVYEITNVWSQDEIKSPLSSEARLEISKQNNVDEIRYTHQKPYILIKNSNTNCNDSWEPHYARFGADVIRHQIEYASGLQKSPDPNITLYNSVPSKQDQAKHEFQILSGYSQFVPICTSKDITSFDYSIKINDEAVGFDVYFISSTEQQENYDQNNGKFQHYVDGQCFGKNYERFSGTCNNVAKDSGLLIVLPDSLSLPLTKLEIWLYEK
ncbi:MAG: hypothetical protein ACT4OD_01720 [Candidatus Nitrosotenuis sp.]